MKPSHAKKVVLVASQPYSAQYESLLLSLIEKPIALFCAAGVDCENWETAFDVLLADPARHFTYHITTTSHPDESLADAINLAEVWSTGEESE